MKGVWSIYSESNLFLFIDWIFAQIVFSVTDVTDVTDRLKEELKTAGLFSPLPPQIGSLHCLGPEGEPCGVEPGFPVFLAMR